MQRNRRIAIQRPTRPATKPKRAPIRQTRSIHTKIQNKKPKRISYTPPYQRPFAHTPHRLFSMQADQTLSSKPVPKLPPTVFILGGPGSGKGTQCERLLESAAKQTAPGLPSKIFHINVGGILRDAQTEYRKQREENSVTEAMAKCGPVLEDMMAKGQILPSWVTVSLMKEEMIKIANEIDLARETDPTYTGGLLIDGFPRSVENLQSFESIVGIARRLIVLDCAADEMIKRVLSRSQTSGREDDMSEDTIKKRINVFNTQTNDVLTQYDIVHSAEEALQHASSERIGVKINGDRPPHEVEVDFINAFSTLTTKL